jgi:broad specificity phosphatase PhoE
MHKYTIAALALLIFISTAAFADNKAPWGHGKLTPTGYKPQKVVYDVTTGKPEIMDHVQDRASYLSTITGAEPFAQSIVLVLHGLTIRFFAIENNGKYRDMLTRAESLVSV